MPPLPPTRASLLVRLRDPADAAAWAEFVRVYGPAVYAFAAARGFQPADAADLTQDVFRQVAGAVGRFAPRAADGSFRGWLFTIVRRECGRERRKQARRPEPLAADVPARAEAADWDAAVRAQWLSVALDELKDQVSDSTWRAFHLTAVEGRSGDEAAAELGITRASVYLARGRMLARLRELVAKYAEDEA
jgi:RNA polymerase sigma factor (sigma-70 family)